jgi:hypothetical protein
MREETTNCITHLTPLPIPEAENLEAKMRGLQVSDVRDVMSVNFELVMTYIFVIHGNKLNSDNILVFLPDYESLITLKRMIYYHPSKKLKEGSFIVYTLHSEMRTVDYGRMLNTHYPEKRKIILCTDLAESCLTLQSATVIDTGKVRRREGENGSSICWISQSSADERARRAKNGNCYRIYTEDCYQAMQKYSVPGAKNIATDKFFIYSSSLFVECRTMPSGFFQRLVSLENSVSLFQPVRTYKLQLWTQICDSRLI